MLTDFRLRLRALFNRADVEHHLAFGHVDELKQEYRDALGVRLADELSQDLHHTVRALSRARGFTVAAILTLAVAGSATTAMFTVVEGVLLRRLPIEQPDRVVVAWSELRKAGAAHWPFRATEIADIKKATRVFASVAGVDYNGAGRKVVTENGVPSYIKCAAVTGEFFDVLGVSPLLGRALHPLDDIAGAPGVIVLSHNVWAQRYGSDPAVLGRVLTIADRPFTVVGVMGADIEFPRGVQGWLSVAAETAILTNAAFRIDLDLIGRLRPNASLADASGELASLSRRFDQEAGAGASRPKGLSPVVRAYKDVLVGDARSALLLLSGAVALVLVIATANIANLFLVRGQARTVELAIRTALGANRAQLVRLIVGESVGLGLASIVVALLLTWSLVPVVIRLVPDGLPCVESIRIDVAVVLFSIAIGLAAAVAAGVWSALKTARTDISDELRTGGTRSTMALTRSRRLLIIGETAVAVIVIAGAVMLVRSLIALESIDMGLAADKILFVDLELPGTRYVARQARVQLLKDVTVALPGGPIASATPVNVLPFSGTGGWDLARFTAEGQSEEAGASNPSLNLEAIGPTYFDTFQIELSRGRAFSEYDRQGQPNVAIVSDDVAARIWPATDAIGKRLKMGTLSSNGAWWTIVGVVKGTRYRDLLDARPTLYVPAEQFVVAASIMAVRTTAPTSEVAPLVRERLRTVDPDVKAIQIAPMLELARKPLARPRFDTMLLTACGVVALSLAVIGVYAIISSRVRERFAEIGVRLALGATAADIMTMVMAEGLRFVTIGVVAGVVTALVAGRLIQNLWFGIAGFDMLTLSGTAALLVAACAVACYLPARRAMRIEPATLFRAS